MQNRPIYFVGGDKGGVGKSLVAMALIDYLAGKGQPLVLVETDTSNPDVYRSYESEAGVLAESIDLDRADGWITAVNLFDRHPDRAVVINTAARNHVGLTAYGATLHDALPDLRRPLICLWVINRQRDSLNLLKTFADTMPDATIHVARNLYWGTPEKFELYNGSNLRDELETRGGQTLDFPDLADRVADDLFSSRLSIAGALRDSPLGNRAELRRWQKACARALGAVTGLDETDKARGDVREATA